MNVDDLRNELERLEIPRNLYSIMQGGMPNEKLCLRKVKRYARGN